MPTRTEAIQGFLNHRAEPDFARLYSYDMEVQVNVAQDGGVRIDGDFKGKKWHGWTDHLTTWKSFRIPYRASSEPEYEDREIRFDLDAHAEGIGMTGWDWVSKCSKWVAFDFDAIMGHSEGLTNEQLEEVKQTAIDIPWVTIRKSSSGKGLHLYVFLDDAPTANHNEHAALARAILGKMSAITGFDFQSHVDVMGGNIWVWHRKTGDTDGFKCVKKGAVLRDIPLNWKDHIQVITGHRRKNMPQDITGADNIDLFDELAGQRPKVSLDENHKKLIQFLTNIGAVWWWDQDHHMLVTHTIYLKEAHEALSMRGYFETDAKGTEKGADHNCFLFVMRRGAWSVRRFSPGCQEHDSWDQDGSGWTRCYLNREPDLKTACRAFGGLEDPSGGFVFREAEVAMKAAQLLGVTLKIGTPLMGRETKLKQHKDGRLIAIVERKEADRGEEMGGWLPKKQDWTKIHNTQVSAPSEPDTANYDDMVRHLVTESGEDYGWMIKSDGYWRNEPLAHIRIALGSLGLKHGEVSTILGSSIFKCWKVVNKPFQPEYPGDREWNRNAAQFRFLPTKNRELHVYPTWFKILQHCGSGLDETIQDNGWCKANGILTGADYLKCWIASLFREPTEPLPYLFMYGPQNSGKSIFHEALSLLLTKGYKRADAALISQAGFNAELEGAIICVVEETDLKKNKSAYNRIKDWVTSRELLIHAKGKTPFHAKNATHWVHCLPKNTWVLTAEGPQQIGNLINKSVTVVVNGLKYKTKGFFKTGVRDIYTVTTTAGRILEATSDHLVKCKFDDLEYWCELGKLTQGTEICLNKHIDATWGSIDTYEDGYLLGWLFGDGTLFKRSNGEIVKHLYVYPDDYNCIKYLENCFGKSNYTITHRQDGAYVIRSKYFTELCKNYGIGSKKVITREIQQSSSEFQSSFISGLFDTDGSCVKPRHIITLYQSDKEFLQTIQRMLLNFGINSHIYLARPSRKLTIYNNKKPTISKTSYQLVIRNKENLKRFRNRIGFNLPRKQESLNKILDSWSRKAIKDSFTAKVQSIQYSRTEDVYDITVPQVHAFDANGFIVHNCANDHQACPIFTGDTRITMLYVKSLDPIEMIPKKKLIPMLEQEAPDFLAEVIGLELPPSSDRLNVPVVETDDKLIAQQLNQTELESFISEKTQLAEGHMIKFSEFVDKLYEWMDPNEIHHWTKIRIGRSLPPQLPHARIRKDGQFYIGNLCWAGTPMDEDKETFKLVSKNGYLVEIKHD